MSPSPFHPLAADAAGVLSWIHLGDLHMTVRGEQNEHDLHALVAEINAAFTGAVSFVYLPGDVADDGSASAYAVVRKALDKLQLPWCAILGDHDVHEHSFANFLNAMGSVTRYAFTVGHVRFLAMNAFDQPHPASFAVLPDQLQWLAQQLQEATVHRQMKCILLHCYPSDLKVGREELIELIRKYHVRLIDMGHTHYNEIANDGLTLYTATRSTGQIEEGPVGFSIANIDQEVISWRFVELGKLPTVIITSPSDHRLLPDASSAQGTPGPLRIRAKIWSTAEITHVWADMERRHHQMQRVPGSNVWQLSMDTAGIPSGVYPLLVQIEDSDGRTAEDVIHVRIGAAPSPALRAPRDQDNALAPWPEHGLLGTQLGPNKNGRKW